MVDFDRKGLPEGQCAEFWPGLLIGLYKRRWEVGNIFDTHTQCGTSSGCLPEKTELYYACAVGRAA
jgi:hypothetical protein